MRSGKRALPEVYLSRTRHAVPGVYLSDPAEGHHGSRIKWLISTCVAGAVGLVAIGFTIYASMDLDDTDSVLDAMERAGRAALRPFEIAPPSRLASGTAVHKTDRLQTLTSGLTTKHIIQDRTERKAGNRRKVMIKPYALVVARLASAETPDAEPIPPFNPFKLYADLKPVGAGAGEGDKRHGATNITARIVDLIAGALPDEDGQTLSEDEVQALVARAAEAYLAPLAAASAAAPGQDAGSAISVDEASAHERAMRSVGPYTTVLEKTVPEPEPSDELEGQEVRVIKVRRGDTLIGILRRAGAEPWQARAIIEAAAGVFKATALSPGQEIRLTLVPSLTKPDAMDPVAVSIFAPGQRHLVTVLRDAGGDYVASKAPFAGSLQTAMRATRKLKRATLYSSLYHAALMQNLPPAMILKILRIHAYDTDFKRRVGPGDGFEAFFDIKDDDPGATGADGQPGALLYTAITVGGETRRFYRFRTPDGVVDYYDAAGNNAKKFLMRKPIKGGGVRFTSGFGLRYHPILKRRRMHKGADWAGRPGIPILAAGNGVIEAAERKRGYGNYVRIRHANGYKTAYAHMLRLAKGVRKGVKVRQGQVIGYVGSTGLSSGPHLHYEVLVNNRHVDPMRIHVPRGRQLKGKLLAAFQKERMRIDALMSLSPVTTRVAQVGGSSG